MRAMSVGAECLHNRLGRGGGRRTGRGGERRGGIRWRAWRCGPTCDESRDWALVGTYLTFSLVLAILKFFGTVEWGLGE